MRKFFHDCFHEPAIGALFLFSLALVVALLWLIVKDRREKRHYLRWLERRRRRIKERAARAAQAPKPPRHSG